MSTKLKHARTATLNIAYEETGPAAGKPVFLMHGFPDDVRAWDGVVAPLAAGGHRVIVPYLRGYGPTRFRRAKTPRSGQQAALGDDLLALMDALRIERAALAGYDWGGRACCIVAALRPARVSALVTIGGYNIQNIATAIQPAIPDREMRHWYQWYFHTERGREGLRANTRDLCGLLWKLWSPNWRFDDATLDRTAQSWQNPDFVDVVIQSYRHRHRAAPGDPALDSIEALLAAQPDISVPTINLHGGADGVGPVEQTDSAAKKFTARYERRIIAGAGHFLPWEAPEAVLQALHDLGA
ncbi:MAG: alpha/beta hydrolase [Acetobacteraceae bacterium]|nr:alpha/beta hydrolase [Acetobacteraceae bacterium]MSP31018.1 alpha/beta hydrolase [Acetobacteraceae bacterium]